MASPVLCLIQIRVDSDTPSFAAITCVAPGVRFSDFAIFLTPVLAFAMAFICRTSSLVHSRRMIFFLVLAIVAPVLWTGLVPCGSELATVQEALGLFTAQAREAHATRVAICWRRGMRIGAEWIGELHQGHVVMLAIENSKLDARQKTICRGC